MVGVIKEICYIVLRQCYTLHSAVSEIVSLVLLKLWYDFTAL